MGQAKRRRSAAATTNSGAQVDCDKLARALRATLSPVGQDQGIEGGDCMRYASIGAEPLRQLGMPARLQVGDAVWRVGPGVGVYAYAARSIPQGLRIPSPEGIGMVTEIVLFCYSELLAGRTPIASLQSAADVEALLAHAASSSPRGFLRR